jgi:hypothetical protein
MPCGFHELNLENSYTAPAEVVPNVQDERRHMGSTVLHTAEAIFIVILSLRCWLGLELTTLAGHSGAIGIVMVSWRHLHRGMGEEKMRRRGRV